MSVCVCERERERERESRMELRKKYMKREGGKSNLMVG